MRTLIVFLLVLTTLGGCLEDENGANTDEGTEPTHDADLEPTAPADPDTEPETEETAAAENGTSGEPGQPGRPGMPLAPKYRVAARNVTLGPDGLLEGSLDFALEAGEYTLLFEPMTGAFLSAGGSLGSCQHVSSYGGGGAIVAGAGASTNGLSRGKQHNCGLLEAGTHTVEATAEGIVNVHVALYRYP